MLEKSILFLLAVLGTALSFSRQMKSMSTVTLKKQADIDRRGLLFSSTMSDAGVTTEEASRTCGSVATSATILGAGPTGLATAIMLARRGYFVQVYERLSEPPSPDNEVWGTGERSYNIGISGRGQNTLNFLDVMTRIEKYSSDVVGRKDWAPGTPTNAPREIVYTGKSYTTKCIQRDLLASAFLEEIRERYADKIKVIFDNEVTDVTFAADGQCFMDITSKSDATKLVVTTNFLIGADGAPSALRESMENDKDGGKFSVTRYEDKNVRLYRTIPLHFPKSDPEKKKWRGDLNYSARTSSDINIDALPTKNGPYVGVVLYRPWDKRMKMKSADDARKFFDEILPMFSNVVREEDLVNFAAKGDSKLPRFMYAGPELHKKRSVLLGDAIHTVKPYFGLGVNTAFEDVLALNNALEENADRLEEALSDFSKARGVEARNMVQISHRLDGGFLTFVLPLIIDNILHKAFPRVFSPNTLSSLQNEKVTFTQVRRRKRLDRFLQFTLLGSSLLITQAAIRFAFTRLARAFL